jgi:hypothetical protein
MLSEDLEPRPVLKLTLKGVCDGEVPYLSVIQDHYSVAVQHCLQPVSNCQH